MEPNADDKRLDYRVIVGPAYKDFLRICHYRLCDKTLFLKGSVQHPSPASRPDDYKKLVCSMCTNSKCCSLSLSKPHLVYSYLFNQATHRD